MNPTRSFLNDKKDLVFSNKVLENTVFYRFLSEGERKNFFAPERKNYFAPK